MTITKYWRPTFSLNVMPCYLVNRCHWLEDICCFLYTKDGGRRYLPNSACHLEDYTASHHKTIITFSHQHYLSFGIACQVGWKKFHISEKCKTSIIRVKRQKIPPKCTIYLPNNMAPHNKILQPWYPSAYDSNLKEKITLKKFKDTLMLCNLNSHPTTDTTWQQTKFWGLSRNGSFTLRNKATAFCKKNTE